MTVPYRRIGIMQWLDGRCSPIDAGYFCPGLTPACFATAFHFLMSCFT